MVEAAPQRWQRAGGSLSVDVKVLSRAVNTVRFSARESSCASRQMRFQNLVRQQRGPGAEAEFALLSASATSSWVRVASSVEASQVRTSALSSSVRAPSAGWRRCSAGMARRKSLTIGRQSRRHWRALPILPHACQRRCAAKGAGGGGCYVRVGKPGGWWVTVCGGEEGGVQLLPFAEPECLRATTGGVERVVHLVRRAPRVAAQHPPGVEGEGGACSRVVRVGGDGGEGGGEGVRVDPDGCLACDVNHDGEARKGVDACEEAGGAASPG